MANNRKRKKYQGIDTDYNYLVVDTLIDMIQTTNDIPRSCQAVDIPISTFNSWLSTYKDFAKRVEEAQEIYRENSPIALKAAAQRELTKYLMGKQTRSSTVKETFLDENGVVRNSRIIEKTEAIETPRWAIERVLGTEVSEMDALKTLIEHEWLDPDVIDQISDRLSQLNQDIKHILSSSK